MKENIDELLAWLDRCDDCSHVQFNSGTKLAIRRILSAWPEVEALVEAAEIANDHLDETGRSFREVAYNHKGAVGSNCDCYACTRLETYASRNDELDKALAALRAKLGDAPRTMFIDQETGREPDVHAKAKLGE